MSNRQSDYLGHIREAAALACEYTKDMDKAAFLVDRKTQQAVVMNLMIIGEASTKLLQDCSEFTEKYPDLPWRSMKGMRNRIAHGYFAIDMEIVWETVQIALPQLLEQLADLDRNETDYSP